MASPFDQTLLDVIQKKSGITFVFILLLMSIALGVVVGIISPNPDLIVDFSPAETKKWISLAGIIAVLVGASFLVRNGLKAYCLLFPITLSFSFTLFTVGITLNQFNEMNILGYRPLVFMYEPLVFVGIFLGISKIQVRRMSGSGHLPLIFFIFYLFITTLSFPFAYNLSYAWIGLFALGKFVLWYFVFSLILKTDLELIHLVTIGFSGLVFFQSIVAITQKFGLQIFGNLVDWTSGSFITRGGVVRVGGTVGRVPLESILLLIIPILFTYSSLPQKKYFDRGRWFVLVSAFLGTITLFLTNTRGPIFSAVIGVIVSLGFVQRNRQRHSNFRIYIFIFLAAVLVGSIIFLSSGSIEDTLFRKTYLDRWRTYIVSMRIVQSNPLLGVGLNNYLFVAPKYGLSLEDIRFGRSVHNQYLLVLTENGLLGFGAFMLFIINSMSTIMKGINRFRNNSHLLWFPIGILGSFTAFLVVSIISNTLVQDQVIVVLAILLSASSAILNHNITHPSNDLNIRNIQ